MDIDKSRLKIGLWYEDETGKRIPFNDTCELPPNAKTYHSCFPLQITESIRKCHSEEQKKNCKHKRKWLKKNNDLIKGYKGRICTACGCSQTRKTWQPWGRKWDKGADTTPLVEFHTTIGKGNQDVIMNMVNSGDYTLSEALVVYSCACERCSNVLAYRYSEGKYGYPEFSDEWKEANTECEFCR